MNLSQIPLNEIPESGLHLEGSLPAGIFDIDPADAVALGPLDYQLDIFLSADQMVASGRLHCEFERECVRCLEKFTQPVTLDPFTAEIELEGSNTINLTERLREDILLSLPAYPHCDSSNDGRKCPAAERFSSPDTPEPGESDRKPRSGVWDVLQDWNPNAPND